MDSLENKSHFDAVKFLNTRTDSLDWQNIVNIDSTDLTIGVDREYGTPVYAWRFYTNLPDSSLAPAGARTALRLDWVDPFGDNTGPRNEESAFIEIRDGGTQAYEIRKEGIAMWQANSASSKKISWEGGKTGHTAIGETDSVRTYIKVNGPDDGPGELDLLTYGGNDSARVDVQRAIIDYLTIVPWTGVLPPTARATEFGDGTAFYRMEDTAPATGTLFIWVAADTGYHYWASDGIVRP